MGVPISEILTKAATPAIPDTGYDFIVSIDSTGLITATPTHTPLTIVTGGELGSVINACVAQFVATPFGSNGLIFIQPNPQTAGTYTLKTAIDLQAIAGLVSAGGLGDVGAGLLIYLGADGMAIKNAALFQGFRVASGDGKNYTIDIATQGYAADLSASSSANMTIQLDGQVALVGAFNFSVKLNGNSCFVFGLAAGGGLTINAGVQFCTVIGDWNTITDNAGAGKYNYIENSSFLGSLVAPAVALGPTTNTKGTKVQVIVSIGATGTTVSKNGTAVTAAGVTAQTVSVELNEGETITLSQTVGVSWTWWGI